MLPSIHRILRNRYYYMCHKIGPINQYSTIPYMRWGQAWMLLGLVTVLEIEYANLSENN